MPSNNIKQAVYENIKSLMEDKTRRVTDDMPLIGGNGALDSMKLVELCLLLEDAAAELGFEFDWTSESAMSKSKSMFRTAGALAEEFIAQLERAR